ncbi:unnamed protein product [Amoebophrya sp. A120]|nr:unnamed protein product [Amoebophrya sp. A120]|eukprot:GSA120T00023892001.1
MRGSEEGLCTVITMKEIARGVDTWGPLGKIWRRGKSDKALVGQYVAEAKKWLKKFTPTSWRRFAEAFNFGYFRQGAERIFLVVERLARPQVDGGRDVGLNFSPVRNEGDMELVFGAFQNEVKRRDEELRQNEDERGRARARGATSKH